MALQPISSLIGASVRRAGVERQARAAQAFERLEKYVQEKFGAAAAHKATPKTLINNTLTIEVSSSALRAELKTLQPEILEALNKKASGIDQLLVERLVFRTG